MVATVKAMAERGRNEINGQPVEYWLNILNQDATNAIVATDTMVLTYRGQEFFFVLGGVAYWGPPSNAGCSCSLAKACFLVAVGESAVRLLSDQGQIFRLITGSAELAAYSIFRWSAFANMLTAEKKL
jgi:hypothetical protein